MPAPRDFPIRPRAAARDLARGRIRQLEMQRLALLVVAGVLSFLLAAQFVLGA